MKSTFNFAVYIVLYVICKELMIWTIHISNQFTDPSFVIQHFYLCTELVIIVAIMSQNVEILTYNREFILEMLPILLTYFKAILLGYR